MKKLLFFLFLLLSTAKSIGQQQSNLDYEAAYLELDSMLTGQKALSFKRAVFITENAYLVNKIDYALYEGYILDLTNLIRDWLLFNRLEKYHFADSVQMNQNYAIYKVLKDTVKIFKTATSGIAHLPYTYEFEDFFGQQDWRNMFVTKLMAAHSGNCQSLPYLYKILADELQAPCWISLAPNHIYIKNRSKKVGWYNTELTSGDFPIDAWIMASGYMPLQAIQNGIYMDTLSDRQLIALTVLDLAKGYENKYKNYNDGFIIKCCDLSLQYFPLNVKALLLKAETLKRIYQQQVKNSDMTAPTIYQEMEGLYVKLFDLGYREMPETMYAQWLKAVIDEKGKYTNQKLKETLPVKKAF